MKITEIIKYEGDNSTFVWKHPSEDFNCLSQLIVHESQEAVLFMNGQALDLFGPGRYTLDTQNIPVLGKLLNLATGGDSPFHCEVYYINKTVQMAVKWGTDSRVRFIDPLTDVPLDIGACGEMNLQVSDSRKLLTKLVGTMNGVAWNGGKEYFSKSLNDCFRPLISTAVKANLSATIKQSKLDILEIDEHLEELSEFLRDKIVPGFEEYGLTIPQLYVTNVSLPENDPNFKKIRELHTISFQERFIEAEAQIGSAKVAAERQIELERQATQTEIAKAEAERQRVFAEKELIIAQTEAQKAKLEGFAEAEVMAAQGITKKDYVQADVQKAFAEGLGNMGSGGGAGGSMMGDIVGLGVGLQAANAMSGQLGGVFTGFAGGQTAEVQSVSTIKCASCGNTLPQNAKFCLECGTKVENLTDNEVICPECGKKTPKGKFCMECGASFIVKCPKCGAEIPAGGKFCLECGEKL